jgi:glycosyltransferase involved in cell wall biosynthesis
MRALNVLNIIASADPASGGVIEGVLRLHDAAGGRGSMEILTLDPPDAAFLRGLPLPVHACGRPSRPAGSPLERFLQHYRYAPGMKHWLRRRARGYDAIVVHGLWNYAALGSSQVLPALDVPYFVFVHGMLDPWFARQYPRKHLVKHLSWLLAEGRLLHGAQAVLFTAEDERALARGQFLGWRYHEEVVGFGALAPPAAAPAAAQRLRADLGIGAAQPFFLFLGRLHPKKGCDLLIEAFARLADEAPGHALVMAGPDQLGWRADLQALAESCGVADRLRWPGMISGDLKWAAIRAADALVLPSHQENFGVVVAEALACGTPALISDKVNIWREIVADGAGLVSPDTVDGAHRMLSDFVRLDDGARTAMRTAARRCFDRNFDFNAVSDRFFKTLSRHVAGRARRVGTASGSS